MGVPCLPFLIHHLAVSFVILSYPSSYFNNYCPPFVFCCPSSFLHSLLSFLLCPLSSVYHPTTIAHCLQSLNCHQLSNHLFAPVVSWLLHSIVSSNMIYWKLHLYLSKLSYQAKLSNVQPVMPLQILWLVMPSHQANMSLSVIASIQAKAPNYQTKQFELSHWSENLWLCRAKHPRQSCMLSRKETGHQAVPSCQFIELLR